MKPANQKPFNRMDAFYILAVGLFFCSCIASTYHIAKTLEPGQASLSAGYMQARSIQEISETPIQLVGINGRVGAFKRFELGAEYTLDVSKENDNAFGTIWGDCKIQLTNKDNKLLKPIISTGLLKGYVHNEEAKIHISSLPIMLSIPISDRTTSTILYRYELLSDNFIPESLKDPRHTYALGLEYSLTKPDYQKWNPKVAISIGTLNSIVGGEGDNALIFNLGLIVNSPYKTRTKSNK